MDFLGTISMGLRGPIIRKGDDLVSIAVDTLIDASKQHGFAIEDKDVLAVTEAVVAKSEGNFATVEDIAVDIKNKFGEETVGLIFPIFSRNRFSSILKGIAMGAKQLVIMLNYPSDEVGNHLISMEKVLEKNINPYKDSFTMEEFYKEFGDIRHTFTGVDYVDFYYQLGNKCKIILSNDPKEILKYTKYVINADIHTRKLTKKQLLEAGAAKVVSLDEILSSSVNGSGFNSKYGVLGSNLSDGHTIKMFPEHAQEFVEKVQKLVKERTGKTIEVMVYGDGAFKDPVGGIWELADPVCSPGFTSGLVGTPNEVKFKYIVDNDLSNLSKEEATTKLKEVIATKDKDLKNNMLSQGTTPRRYTDLLASLSDLTSGSGDKGTPFIYIKNYFKNFSM